MNEIQKPISIIVAVDQSGGIGLGNNLLCHISEDLKRFKQLTMGKIIVMGRNTWESLPKKPLPGRIHIILSKTLQPQTSGQVLILPSVQEVLKFLNDKQENFIIGGEQIYKLFLPLTGKIYMTEILYTFHADKFFPALDQHKWQLIEQSEVYFDNVNNVSYLYKTFVRRCDIV